MTAFGPEVLLDQDNARILEYEMLLRSTYSPDLDLSAHFLLPNFEKWLSGKTFSSNDEISAQTNADCEEYNFDYLEGVKKFEKIWKKSMELMGNYVEKYIYIRKMN